jgi:hypothetical protein
MKRVENLILDDGTPAAVGKAFGVMMEFVSGRRIRQLEVVAESPNHPGRLDRLVLRIPAVRITKGKLTALPLAKDRRRGGRRR